jgi:L-lactate dehydrogenase complex protein LldG
MTSRRADASRAAILDGIRRRLHRGPLAPERVASPPPAPIPARARLPHDEQLTLFAAMACELSATVDRLRSRADVPAAAARFIADTGLTGPIRVAPALRDLAWSDAGLAVGFGVADPGDAVSITPAFAGIAETGTLALLSGPDSPTSLNFLPDTHIAVLEAADVVGVYEEVWARLRGSTLPRTINLISGPSRTGDIEQTIQLGAHGPRRLHILLVDGRT